MSKTASYQLNSGAELGEVVAVATQNLQALGYDVASNVMNAQSASILVTKDNEGIKNLLGLGLECTVTLTRLGENQVTITIDEKWTNHLRCRRSTKSFYDNGRFNSTIQRKKRFI